MGTCTQLVHFIMVENVIYLTLLGPSAVGKSTLAGRMIHQCGGIELGTMELLQTHDVKKYDEVYKMIVSSGLDPDFYIPPRQRVRFVRASETPDAAILVVSPSNTALGDVPSGWPENTRKLFQSMKVIVAVNKLDQCSWSEDEFKTAVRETQQELEKHDLAVKDQYFVPISAISGNNMIELSGDSPWFSGTGRDKSKVDKGVTLLEALELVIKGE